MGDDGKRSFVRNALSRVSKIGTNSTTSGSEPSGGNDATRTKATPIEASTFGAQVELGSLFDATTGKYFSGYSLWKFEDIEKNQKLDPTPHTELKISSSLEETRSNFGIDAEGQLAVNLGMFELKGSAKFLKNDSSRKNEARVDITCLKVNRTRSMVMETMVKMTYEKFVFENCPEATHFVAEVIEGAFGNISLTQNCNSSEEAKRVAGSLSASLGKFFKSEGEVNLRHNTEDDCKTESLQINVEGAIDKSIGTFEEAADVGRKLPEQLQSLNNTLRVRLLPVSLVDLSVGRTVRALDDSIVTQVASVLEAANSMVDNVSSLQNMEHLVFYPNLKKQVIGFSAEFNRCFLEFRQSVRKILGKLKQGSDDDGLLVSDLDKKLSFMKRTISISQEFVSKKLIEGGKLSDTLKALETAGLQNCFKIVTEDQSLVLQSNPMHLSLNICGEGLKVTCHPLEKALKNETVRREDSSNSDEEKCEWFQDASILTRLKNSVAELQSLKTQSILGGKNNTIYSFGAFPKAIPPNENQQDETRIGDIILSNNVQNYIVTGYLPRCPENLKLTVHKQIIRASWKAQKNSVLPITGFLIRWRPERNPALEACDDLRGEGKVWVQEKINANELEFCIINHLKGPLHPFTTYEVEIASETEVGFSKFSDTVKARTEKKPTVAKSLINFYFENKDLFERQTSVILPNRNRPWEIVGGRKPCELTKDTLILGFTTVSVQKCSTNDFKDEIAVLIVDIVPEFAPDIKTAEPEDKQARMIMFVGETGSGKTTQINAFVSFLLEGDLTDSHRIVLIDDRHLDQSKSLTPYITVYRIRPLADSFLNNTLYIIDTPAYGDTAGLKTGFHWDKFIRESMVVMFNTLPKMNTIVLTCKSGETTATAGITAVVTTIFQLFAEKFPFFRQCLRTVLTFSDVGTSPALTVLKKLDWPVEPHTLVEVNNSAFRIADADNNKNPKVGSWWKLSMEGQHEVAKMLGSMEAVRIQSRSSLLDNCSTIEKRVLETANAVSNLLRDLDSISRAIGALPGEKVEVKKTKVIHKSVENGKHTTLCIECNFTCHEICSIGDDEGKRGCGAMSNDYCTKCPNKCFWKCHKNARYLFVPEPSSDWVFPEELKTKWNETTNTLEGAAIDATKVYMQMQNVLRSHIDTLVEITEHLNNESLKHNPRALNNYLKYLVKTAKAQGATPEQLDALEAFGTMVLRQNVATGHPNSVNESKVLAEILNDILKELERLSQLSPNDRAAEEELPCNLYNHLRKKLPAELQKKAPAELESSHQSLAHNGPKRFDKTENLKAIIQLLKIILETGKATAVHSEV